MDSGGNSELIEKVKQYVSDAENFANEAKRQFEATSKSALAAAKSAEAAAAANPNAVLDEPKRGKHLNNYLEDYGYYTGKASEISRSLAFAGIAIIWIFRNPEGNLFNYQLLLPLILLIITLGLDLAQYFLGSIFWGVFYERKYYEWKKGTISNTDVQDIKAPNSLSLPLVFVFLVKIIFLIWAYIQLFFFIYYKI